MTISVNDLWGTNIYIKEYTFDENGFKGTLVFNLYDHFWFVRFRGLQAC